MIQRQDTQNHVYYCWSFSNLYYSPLMISDMLFLSSDYIGFLLPQYQSKVYLLCIISKFISDHI